MTIAAVPTPVSPEAVICGRPKEWVVARPAESIVTMLLSDELHLTLLVRSWVLPSLKVPVAVNCCCEPSATLALAGVTSREDNVRDFPPGQPPKTKAVKAKRNAGERTAKQIPLAQANPAHACTFLGTTTTP